MLRGSCARRILATEFLEDTSTALPLSPMSMKENLAAFVVEWPDTLHGRYSSNKSRRSQGQMQVKI